MKIYSQLRPHDTGVNQLLGAQKELSGTTTGRMIEESELHMTVIHFGKVDTVLDSLQNVARQDRPLFERLLDQLVDNWKSHSTDGFELEHTGYDRLGKNKKTIVATFKATRKLEHMHQEHLAALKAFFRACGINDVESFMKNDPNFVNALNLYPHVTLKKGHENHDLPTADMGMMTFTPMKVVY